jgi:hypothetical protein
MCSFSVVSLTSTSHLLCMFVETRNWWTQWAQWQVFIRVHFENGRVSERSIDIFLLVKCFHKQPMEEARNSQLFYGPAFASLNQLPVVHIRYHNHFGWVCPLQILLHDCFCPSIERRKNHKQWPSKGKFATVFAKATYQGYPIQIMSSHTPDTVSLYTTGSTLREFYTLRYHVHFGNPSLHNKNEHELPIFLVYILMCIK